MQHFSSRVVAGTVGDVRSWSVVSVSMSVVSAVSIVDEVDVTEVTVVVGVTVVVVAVFGVTSSRSAWLIVGVTVGADHE